jgi:hypothetical protein
MFGRYGELINWLSGQFTAKAPLAKRQIDAAEISSCID